MADGIVWCKKCEADTGHMHLRKRVCVCSECGTHNEADNWREIVADVERRKAESQAAVDRMNGRVEAVVAEAEPKEIKMRKHLTNEQLQDAARRWNNGKGESIKIIAKELKCNVYKLQKQLREVSELPKPGAYEKEIEMLVETISTKAPPVKASGNPLKDAIRDIVRVEVSGYLADIDRHIDIKVRDVVAGLLK